MGAFFQIYDVRYPDLLVEVEFYIVSHHFPDDSDKFAGTMPKGVIVRTAFSHLGIIISFEGGIIFNNVMSCVYKGVSKYLGSTLGHSGFLCLEVSRLVYRRVQTSICEQLVGARETAYITDFTKYHSAVDISDSWNVFYDRIIEFHDVRHFSFNSF